MTRQTHTPRQRAEQTLGVAQRRVDRLSEQSKKARAALEAVTLELADAQARLAYVQRDPALTRPADGPSDGAGDPGDDVS